MYSISRRNLFRSLDAPPISFLFVTLVTGSTVYWLGTFLWQEARCPCVGPAGAQVRHHFLKPLLRLPFVLEIKQTMNINNI